MQKAVERIREIKTLTFTGTKLQTDVGLAATFPLGV